MRGALVFVVILVLRVLGVLYYNNTCGGQEVGYVYGGTIGYTI